MRSTRPRVLRATLEYDGTRYRGWQVQINARSVQGVLTRAVTEVLGEGVRVNGAGRTDAGVHAFAQVASLHLPAEGRGGPADLEALRAALNDKLPADVNVLALAEAAPSFHARHDAQRRVYRYRIARRRTAFGKPFVWWVKERLDAHAMARAASRLPGRHDFASFCEKPEEQESTLVEVDFVAVEIPAAAPDLVLVRLGASHFLWKMVRRLVGALVQVGTGRLSEEAFAALLRERTSRPAEWTAPPSGLFLESVQYPGESAPPPPDALRPAL